MGFSPPPDRTLIPPARLVLRGVHKQFGSVRALGGVDFSLAAGGVHALLGENGAGKTSLMQVAYGLLKSDRGSTEIDGVSVRVKNPRDARRLGIGMVHQHFTSIPALTVAENIRLFGGDEGILQRLDPWIGHLVDGLDAGATVGTLSVVHQQRLEIVKAIAAGERTLLLDEPTAALAPAEVEELLGWIRAFAMTGGSVVLITHKLDEAIAVAQRVTVMRHGLVTLTGDVADHTESSLASAMLGTTRTGPRPAGHRIPTMGPAAVQAQDLTLAARHDGGRDAIVQATFTICCGEIVGVAAIEGSGQRELLLAVAGVHPVRAGDLNVQGPVAFIPEDRTREGLIPALTLTENLLLGVDTEPLIHRGRWIDWSLARERARELLDEFDVKAPSPDDAAATLSGGNQQKLVLARALERKPRVLVAENPTRGLDLRATAAVHERLLRVAEAGVAVLVYSADLDEVFALADRLLVVARGRVSSVPASADRPEVGRLMLAAPGST